MAAITFHINNIDAATNQTTEATLIDHVGGSGLGFYGGGHGMLALLAKASGIGTVIHNDIYKISCKDAQCIGNDLDLAADDDEGGDDEGGEAQESLWIISDQPNGTITDIVNMCTYFH